MENVREKMRQVYRDKVIIYLIFTKIHNSEGFSILLLKYNLKKRDEAIAMQLRNLDGTLNAQKKDSSMLEIKVDEEGSFFFIKYIYMPLKSF